MDPKNSPLPLDSMSQADRNILIDPILFMKYDFSNSSSKSHDVYSHSYTHSASTPPPAGSVPQSPVVAPIQTAWEYNGHDIETSQYSSSPSVYTFYPKNIGTYTTSSAT
ncbi:hypothetical protein QBC43DRAFT_240001 [Cladorrhinum sp. PSN259]|nr:hypothetical protein QBC43DRAFT_240001 [Cladorrhinum sp. PSN259]